MSNLFHSDCNITDGVCKGVGGCEGGWEAKGRLTPPLRDTAVECVQ